MSDKQTKSAGINIGSVSLFMVFAVLCLTIFSVLSLVTATNELRLAKSFAQSVENYYSADYAACDIIDKIRQNPSAEISGVSTQGNIKSFVVEIDQSQALNVSVDASQEVIKILSWQAKTVEVPIYDNSLPVWTGEEGALQ